MDRTEESGGSDLDPGVNPFLVPDSPAQIDPVHTFLAFFTFNHHSRLNDRISDSPGLTIARLLTANGFPQALPSALLEPAKV